MLQLIELQFYCNSLIAIGIAGLERIAKELEATQELVPMLLAIPTLCSVFCRDRDTSFLLVNLAGY